MEILRLVFGSITFGFVLFLPFILVALGVVFAIVYGLWVFSSKHYNLTSKSRFYSYSFFIVAAISCVLTILAWFSIQDSPDGLAIFSVLPFLSGIALFSFLGVLYHFRIKREESARLTGNTIEQTSKIWLYGLWTVLIFIVLFMFFGYF